MERHWGYGAPKWDIQSTPVAMCQQVISELMITILSSWRVLQRWSSNFFKFRFGPRWVVLIRAYAWCFLPPGCENIFGSESIVWRGITEKGERQEWSLSIPCVFSGLFLQPRPSLMAEENHRQFGSWNIGSTGYATGSGITWPCHGGQGSCSVAVLSWDQQ